MRWEDLLPTLKDQSIDVVIADIPYGINVGDMPYLKGQKRKITQKNGQKLSVNIDTEKYENQDWDNEAPPQNYFDEVCRVSKNQLIFGVEYVNWEGLGSGRIKWDKGVGDGMSFKKYEMIYCSFIDHEIELPLLWSGMCQAKSLSEPMTQQGNKKLNEKREHICQKPKLIYDRLLIDYVKKGETVLDTHLGHGAIRVSCDIYGVNFMGCEINKKTFDKHIKYWNNYKKQLKMF